MDGFMGSKSSDSQESEDSLQRLMDSHLLEDLEKELKQFNPFTALRIVNHEIRHSAFLRWLLDPTESHQQGDLWLKAFLVDAILHCKDANEKKPSVEEVGRWDMSSTEVRTEWNDIDLAILDKTNSIACVVENKVHSGERKGQLNKYWNIIENLDFHFQYRLFLFLTPSGIPPKFDEHGAYSPFSFQWLVDLIERCLATASNIDEKVQDFIDQYCLTIRRSFNMMHDEKDLCVQMYREHYPAVQALRKYRKDRPRQIAPWLGEYLYTRESEKRDILVDDARTIRTPIHRFIPKVMDQLTPQIAFQWTGSGRLLLWELETKNPKGDDTRLNLYLRLGPTHEEDEHIRHKIFSAATEHEQVFNYTHWKTWSSCSTLFANTVVPSEAYYSIEKSELIAMVDKEINRVLRDIVPDMNKVFADVLKEVTPN